MFTCKTRQIFNFINKLNSRRVATRLINNSSYEIKIPSTQSTLIKLTTCNPNLQLYREKHKDSKKSKKTDLTESEDEQELDEWDNEVVDKQTKIVTIRVNSLRADLILKAGLGVARNKIEVLFYDSKIRVNGQKLLKKSALVSIGDEIDIVRGPSLSNPDFLTVSRLEILSASEKGEALTVKVRRNKTLTIENYTEEPHKS